MSVGLGFVHLRVKTEYSLLEGAVRVSELAQLCRKLKMPAVAVTDRNNLFGALEISEKLSGQGIQHIVGLQLDVGVEENGKNGASSAYEEAGISASLLLLAQNEIGYQNLMWLCSEVYDAQTGLPCAGLNALCARNSGLICLTGGGGGLIGQAFQKKGEDFAATLMDRLSGAFDGRLYVELQRHSFEAGLSEKAKSIEHALVKLAYEKDLPLVATNDVHFKDQDFYTAHDTLICIADGTYLDQREERRRLSPEHYFKSGKEMAALFADLPEALENTVEIAKRCAFRVPKRAPILPKFADDERQELRRQAAEGLEGLFAGSSLCEEASLYRERLEFELGIIEEKGYCGYFLIVADFIKWARGQGIPVGPGRGSGAASLVAYSLTITDIDPLRYGLYFERFLNPDRPSMPDFDIDFCMDRRDEVIRYVQKKYGADRVAQIVTFGALLSKMAVRDIGRVLQMPYAQVDRIAKMIPVEGGKPVSIEKALRDEPRLREEMRAEEIVERLMKYSQQVEGLLRNASTHAAGIVIGERPLRELVALYRDPRSELPATQFNMKWVEKAGLVKFDFLGLKTLTVIQRTCDFLARRGVALDISQIPLDDEKTYALYASARTIGVFQLEGAGMMDALRRMRPTGIEDIIALVALYRPGPMENIPKYCEVKNALSEREYLHPLIDDILDETQGIIIYQEQVLRIAQEMAGYSLGEADGLRSAMGKKIHEAMEAERPRFFAGAKEKGVSTEKTTEIWNLLEKFSKYGFNKAHAAAYAVVSYQTAWLKANYPIEFMAALMNCDIHLTDKLSVYIEEARKAQERGGLGIEILPPCINHSNAEFAVIEGKIAYALGALKNVGVAAMRQIEVAREGQPFVSIFDFARRVDLRQIGKRALEMLVNAGAFDQLDPNRARLFEALDALTPYSGACHDQSTSAQVSLFGESGQDLPEPRLPDSLDWVDAERLGGEFSAIGFYLSGHPLDVYMAQLKTQSVQTLQEVSAKIHQASTVVKMAGVVTKIEERKSARGKRFAFVSLSDPTGQYEVIVFSETLDQARDLLEPGAKITFWAEAALQGDQTKLQAREITKIECGAIEAALGLKIYVDKEDAIAEIAAILDKYGRAKAKEAGEITLHLLGAHLPGEVEIGLGETFFANAEIKAALRSVAGIAAVESG